MNSLFESLQEYMDTLNKNSSLYSLYKEVLGFEMDHFIPAVRLDTALFLNMISMFTQPRSVLEVGFGSGLSALSIFKGLTFCESFTSLERDKNRFVRGLSLLKHFNNNTIELIHCNAFDYLQSHSDRFYDFIFLDAVKRDYIAYIEPLKAVLNSGGYLVCDNTLFNGKVVCKDSELEKKYKDGVNLLKEFNRAISEDPDFQSSFYLVGDGLVLCRKL